MRTVRIEKLEYAEYGEIMDSITETIPVALLNQYYSARLHTGFFSFWDSDYIPDEMKPFILQPPVARENKKVFKARLKFLIKKFVEKVNTP